MLIDYAGFLLLIKCILGLWLFATVCAGYAYYVNSRRSDGDPQKKSYPPAAILFAPITLPFFFVLYVFFFILRVLAYGLFFIVFVIAVVAFRKPFLLAWLHKTATAIGNRLLEANTLLIRLFISPLGKSS
jgi:hypothetical protein